jgi:hypothetical protein
MTKRRARASAIASTAVVTTIAQCAKSNEYEHVCELSALQGDRRRLLILQVIRPDHEHQHGHFGHDGCAHHPSLKLARHGKIEPYKCNNRKECETERRCPNGRIRRKAGWGNRIEHSEVSCNQQLNRRHEQLATVLLAFQFLQYARGPCFGVHTPSQHRNERLRERRHSQILVVSGANPMQAGWHRPRSSCMCRLEAGAIRRLPHRVARGPRTHASPCRNRFARSAQYRSTFLDRI